MVVVALAALVALPRKALRARPALATEQLRIRAARAVAVAGFKRTAVAEAGARAILRTAARAQLIKPRARVALLAVVTVESAVGR